MKVRRPDILEKVQLDRSILLFVARCLERLVPSLRLIALEGAMRNFCIAVEEQLHLTNEARNNERFTANFADDPDVLFPKLYPELCSDAVLTMEFIDGVREEDLETAGIDVRRVVEAGMRCVCRMIFLHGFVHADLHPGNMRFLPPGRAVLFDLGLVGSLIDEDRLTTARLAVRLRNRRRQDGGPHLLRQRGAHGDPRLCGLRRRSVRPGRQPTLARPGQYADNAGDRPASSTSCAGITSRRTVT